MRRVSVVGNSGSGKSTLARRLAATLGVRHIEVDSIFHQPGWQQLDRGELARRLDDLTAGPAGWVIDGNYREAIMDGVVWERADTVVWLDLPRSTVMRQVVPRTLRRVLRREELWNGNKEPFRNLYAWNPEQNIIRWAWTQHAKYIERYGSAMTDPARAHLTFVRLRSHAEANAWLAALPGT